MMGFDASGCTTFIVTVSPKQPYTLASCERLLPGVLQQFHPETHRRADPEVPVRPQDEDLAVFSEQSSALIFQVRRRQGNYINIRQIGPHRLNIILIQVQPKYTMTWHSPALHQSTLPARTPQSYIWNSISCPQVPIASVVVNNR